MISRIKGMMIPNWRDWKRMYTTWFHLAGLLFSGIGTGLALVYGSLDTLQHSLIPTWVTYLIMFIIFLGAAVGKFIRQ